MEGLVADMVPSEPSSTWETSLGHKVKLLWVRGAVVGPVDFSRVLLAGETSLEMGLWGWPQLYNCNISASSFEGRILCKTGRANVVSRRYLGMWSWTNGTVLFLASALLLQQAWVAAPASR